ncbi:AAA family ATPase [Methylobacterium nonmethylotrophicum]|uniref:AAA family ATPase n=1 Tax=Methylobacterium nonmethylotrophicum TaxID=1141884 RepID=A0A4Z0NRD4_9HYPH|nr:AAA family ATPase [Methylobacterium nonmethylotrophicum]TGD99673.1 AAA family ATPase [Methylobacterium nonmethylotrophicum]
MTYDLPGDDYKMIDRPKEKTTNESEYTCEHATVTKSTMGQIPEYSMMGLSEWDIFGDPTFEGMTEGDDVIDDQSELSNVGVILETSPELTTEDNKTFFITVELQDFIEENLPERQFVLHPLLPERGLAMLYAGRGVGKTHVALGISFAVSAGGEFLRWRAPTARRVLYVDGEMPQQTLQERARALQAAHNPDIPLDLSFTILSMDRQKLGRNINLANPVHQAEIESLLKNGDLLVIDNISTLVKGGKENDAASWDVMQIWLLQLRRRGVSVLLVHHTGRGDHARGTSKREDVLDTVVMLKRPDDYRMEQGARFQVHLTKARGIAGPDAEPFEAQLNVSNGKAMWTWSSIDDDSTSKIIEHTQAGASVREIAAGLGLSKSAVQRAQTELRASGKL